MSQTNQQNNDNILTPVYADNINWSFNMYTFTADIQSVGIDKLIQILGAIKLSPETAKLVHKELGDCIEKYEELYGVTIPMYTEECKKREQEYSAKLKNANSQIVNSPMYTEPVEFKSENEKTIKNAEKEK